MLQWNIVPLSCLRRINRRTVKAVAVPIIHTIVYESPRQGLAQQTVPEQQKQVFRHKR